ncbi:MAG: thiamine phosphate synthase [Nitrospirae bacterium]|nr:thiamine phosphate synthase [Nitrospirota bacterium]
MTPDWLLYLITDRHLAGQRQLPETVADALRGGVRAIQLREKDLAPRALLELAAEVRALTNSARAVLLINDRIDVMLAVDADGVHLRADSLPTRAVRRILGPGKLIGVSTHSIEAVWRAADEGADFVTFGPVFETPSKIRYCPPVGVGALAEACRHSGVPVFALGGITRDRIAAVMGAGAHGVAVISEIIAARDIQSAARACVATVSASEGSRAVDPSFRRCYN